MVTVAVLAVVLVAAVPSFNEFRQRSALRGAAEQVTSFWANARFEALKRNSLVKVSMGTSSANYCMGAAVTTDPTDDDGCDCFETDTTDSDYCAVGRYPASQTEWQRIRYLDDPEDTIGDDGVVIIDPKRAALASSATTGYWEMGSPTGGPDYRLRVNIDQFGRAVTCEPAAAGSKMPQYADKRCN